MSEDILAVFEFNSNRLHQATAIGSSVAGVDIHVLAPKAIRAVVGITVAMDMRATVFASEIFNLAIKSFHYFLLIAQVKHYLGLWQENFDEVVFLSPEDSLLTHWTKCGILIDVKYNNYDEKLIN